MDALRLGERAGDELLRAHARSHAANWQLHLHGCRMQDVAMAEEAVAAAAAAGDREVVLYTMAILALLQSARSEYRTATRTTGDGIEIARDAGDAYTYLWFLYIQAEALVHLGEWGAALVAIDTGVNMATQIGNLDAVSLFGSEVAFLHGRAHDFSGAAALARHALRRESLTAGARQNATFELAFAHLGLGELDEAHALFTAPDLAWPPEVGAMPWSAQLRLREGLSEVWLRRGDLKRARGELCALQTSQPADEPTRAHAPLAQRSRCRRQLGSQTPLRVALAAVEGAMPSSVACRRRRRAPLRVDDAALQLTARARSAAVLARRPHPTGHDLRRSFLGAPAVREVLDRAGQCEGAARVGAGPARMTRRHDCALDVRDSALQRSTSAQPRATSVADTSAHSTTARRARRQMTRSSIGRDRRTRRHRRKPARRRTGPRRRRPMARPHSLKRISTERAERGDTLCTDPDDDERP
jgi:hypothetical protein